MARPKNMNRDQMVAEVEKLRADGMKTADACKKVGIHYTTFYQAKREAGSNKAGKARSEQSEVSWLRRENELLRKIAGLN